MSSTRKWIVTVQYCREYHIEVKAARAEVQSLGQVQEQREQ